MKESEVQALTGLLHEVLGRISTLEKRMSRVEDLLGSKMGSGAKLKVEMPEAQPQLDEGDR